MNWLQRSIAMFKHNILIILRNFKRNKSTFFINLFGLSTGLAGALLIFLWIHDERNVDKFFENDGRLYQVMQNFELPQGIQTWNYTPAPLAAALSDEMTDVKYAVSVGNSFNRMNGTLSNGDIQIKARGLPAGKDYFNVFSYKLFQGDRKHVLHDKNGVVISEETALKLFKTYQNIAGKTLNWTSNQLSGTYYVSGVFKSPPPSATSQFDIKFNFELLVENTPNTNGWKDDPAETYIFLNKNVNIRDFNEKIAGFLKAKHSSREKSTLFVQQYSKRYLYGKYENGLQAGGRIDYLKLFSLIGIFILIIACINFMNLSTAKASTRMKEIGVKKTMGINRKSLAIQYLSEAIIMVFISLVVASLLIALFLPQYNILTGKQLSFHFNMNLLLSVLAITLLTGLISGSYPALYLSGLNPIAILKGNIKNSRGELRVRKGLVIFQFTLSVVFIIGFLVINKQIEFTQTKNLGYDRDNIISFQWKTGFSGDALQGLKNIPGVVNATNMNMDFIKNIDTQAGYSWREHASDKNYLFQSPRIGYDFIETLGLEIKEGRSFSRDHGNEISKIMINESAAKMMALQNPIGKIIDYGDEGDSRQIIGVVKDFNYGSIHERIKPLIFRFRGNGETVLVKIKAGTEAAAIQRIKAFYKEFHPDYAFEFTFMDDDYQALYDSEMRVGALSKYFALIAIIISCLGLFGLTSFIAEKRRKEMGIRKILGSSSLGIVKLLSVDFTRLVLVAILIAFPVSFFAAKEWLNTFAFRIDLKPLYFFSAGILTILIAWLTVSIQAVKIARMNPVNSLKSE